MMPNPYGLSEKELVEIRERDKFCVYCHKKLLYPWNSKNRMDSATIEHLNYKQDWDSVRSYKREGKPVATIIAMCCGSCNSSRGSKSLRDWFGSDYCKDKGISYGTVSAVVKKYMDQYESR